MVACQEKKDEKHLYLGLNGEIIELDQENQIVYVKDIDEGDKVFGENCSINCKKAIENGQLIYVDYEGKDEPKQINFSDLQISDHLIIGLTESELEKAREEAATAESIQLSSQRIN